MLSKTWGRAKPRVCKQPARPEAKCKYQAGNIFISFCVEAIYKSLKRCAIIHTSTKQLASQADDSMTLALIEQGQLRYST